MLFKCKEGESLLILTLFLHYELLENFWKKNYKNICLSLQRKTFFL